VRLDTAARRPTPDVNYRLRNNHAGGSGLKKNCQEERPRHAKQSETRAALIGACAWLTKRKKKAKSNGWRYRAAISPIYVKSAGPRGTFTRPRRLMGKRADRTFIIGAAHLSTRLPHPPPPRPDSCKRFRCGAQANLNTRLALKISCRIGGESRGWKSHARVNGFVTFVPRLVVSSSTRPLIYLEYRNGLGKFREPLQIWHFRQTLTRANDRKTC
jgi:hypothetical protein